MADYKWQNWALVAVSLAFILSLGIHVRNINTDERYDAVSTVEGSGIKKYDELMMIKEETTTAGPPTPPPPPPPPRQQRSPQSKRRDEINFVRQEDAGAFKKQLIIVPFEQMNRRKPWERKTEAAAARARDRWENKKAARIRTIRRKRQQRFYPAAQGGQMKKIDNDGPGKYIAAAAERAVAAIQDDDDNSKHYTSRPIVERSKVYAVAKKRNGSEPIKKLRLKRVVDRGRQRASTKSISSTFKRSCDSTPRDLNGNKNYDFLRRQVPEEHNRPYDISQHTAFEPLMYLHMQKAAGTSITQTLKSICPSLDLPCEAVEANVLLQKKPRISRTRGAFVVGSIRNPFDWYVSLFAYGCSESGSLYAAMRRHELEPYGLSGILKKGGHRNVNNFRTWMRILFRGVVNVSRRKPKTRVTPIKFLAESRSLGIGLMTYRFALLYIDSFAAKKGRSISYASKANHTISTASNSTNERSGRIWALTSNQLNSCHFIRTERLTETMSDMFYHYAHWRGKPIESERIRSLVDEHLVHANAARRDSAYQSYYDRETRAMVEKGDAAILDFFGYTFGGEI